MNKMNFLIITMGLVSGLIFFAIFLPMRDQIEENREFQNLTRGLVNELRAREQRQIELKTELEKLEGELKELEEEFVKNHEEMQMFKSYFVERAKARQLTAKELELISSGESTLLKGKWKGNFIDLLSFLQDLDTVPFFFELLKVLFQVEQEMILGVTGEIPLIKGGDLNDF